MSKRLVINDTRRIQFYSNVLPLKVLIFDPLGCNQFNGALLKLSNSDMYQQTPWINGFQCIQIEQGKILLRWLVYRIRCCLNMLLHLVRWAGKRPNKADCSGSICRIHPDESRGACHGIATAMLNISFRRRLGFCAHRGAAITLLVPWLKGWRRTRRDGLYGAGNSRTERPRFRDLPPQGSAASNQIHIFCRNQD